MIIYTQKHGVPFIIDVDDFDQVSRYTWHISDHGYPRTNTGKQPHVRPLTLHLFLLGHAPDGLEWDHANRNKLDNRRENLRLVTPNENKRNIDAHLDNSSGVRGVSWEKDKRRWRAQIFVGGKVIRVGRYRTIEEATAARLQAERDQWS